MMTKFKTTDGGERIIKIYNSMAKERLFQVLDINGKDEIGRFETLNEALKFAEETIADTIVAFHIGRGGRYYNSGHLTYLGEHRIGHYVDDLFLTPENAYYVGQKIAGRPNLEAKLQEALEGSKEAVSFFERIGFDLGDNAYTCGGEHFVGLSEEECNSGVGRINIDNEYNTTYCKHLSDCNETELQLVYDEVKKHLYNDGLFEYLREQLNIQEQEP